MRVHKRSLFVYFFIFCLLFFSSCKKTKEVKKEQAVSEVKESISNNEKNINKELSKNERIVRRLKEMKVAFEDENKEGMLQFFRFPAKKTLFIRKNKRFKDKIAANNNEITEEDFLEHAKIQKSPNHPNLYQLLVTLDLDSLKKTDSIEKDLEVEGDECYYMYKVEINDDILTISYGSNSNQKYSDEGDCSERHTFLYFKIVNDKIIFEKSDAAG